MSDFTWPEDLVPFAQSFYLQPHTGRSESPFTRQQKIYGLSAPRWVTKMSFRGGYDGRTGQAAYGPRLDALLAELAGGQASITAWDFRRSDPFFDDNEVWSDNTAFRDHTGFVRPAPIANAQILAGAASAVFTGFMDADPSFAIGQYVGGDGRPHIITGVAREGGSVTVTFKPAFKATVAAGDAIWRNMPGSFRLTADDGGAAVAAAGEIVQFELELVEDL